jgi:hypothetical protein
VMRAPPPSAVPPGRFASRRAAIVIMPHGWLGRRAWLRCQRASTANSNSATILVILIIGLTAGPAVSL